EAWTSGLPCLRLGSLGSSWAQTPGASPAASPNTTPIPSNRRHTGDNMPLLLDKKVMGGMRVTRPVTRLKQPGAVFSPEEPATRLGGAVVGRAAAATIGAAVAPLPPVPVEVL